MGKHRFSLVSLNTPWWPGNTWGKEAAALSHKRHARLRLAIGSAALLLSTRAIAGPAATDSRDRPPESLAVFLVPETLYLTGNNAWINTETGGSVQLRLAKISLGVHAARFGYGAYSSTEGCLNRYCPDYRVRFGVDLERHFNSGWWFGVDAELAYAEGAWHNSDLTLVKESRSGVVLTPKFGIDFLARSSHFTGGAGLFTGLQLGGVAGCSGAALMLGLRLPLGFH